MNAILKRGFLPLLLLLAACATPIVTKNPSQPAFGFNGRVAIKHQSQRSNIGVNWLHGAEKDDILLLAPLGQTIGQIHLDEQGVMLNYGGKQYQAKDAESLTERVLGWNLPVAGLRYWVQAESAVGRAAQIERNAAGQVILLRQDGWEIHYVKYASDNHDALPQRVELRRDDIELTVLIDEWLQP